MLSEALAAQVSLPGQGEEARAKRDTARELLAAGVDPGEHKKATRAASEERAGNSFEVVAHEWFAKQKASWVDSHADKILPQAGERHLSVAGG